MWQSIKQLRARFCISLALLVLAPLGGRAGELYIYEHNGSIMNWYVVGDHIRTMYETPRLGLAEAGITSGTVLFKGEYEGSRIIGIAYAFKRGCLPAPYSVIGYDSGDEIVLSGPAPVRTGCIVTRYSATSPHARLIFKYSATHH